MIVTIELSEDQAAVLKVLAEAAGLTVERSLGQIAAQLARHPPPSPTCSREIPRSGGRQFHQWAEWHDRTTPLLSDQVVRHESIYPDRV
jgi:hypothetical protein